MLLSLACAADTASVVVVGAVWLVVDCPKLGCAAKLSVSYRELSRGAHDEVLVPVVVTVVVTLSAWAAARVPLRCNTPSTACWSHVPSSPCRAIDRLTQ